MNQSKIHRQSRETEQKALEINLDDKIYGTFAEIGAGQEVARQFFQAGKASQTIALTINQSWGSTIPAWEEPVWAALE